MAGKVQSWMEKLYRVFSNDLSDEQAKGIYVPSRDSIRVLPENETLFGEQLIAQRRTSISINSTFGTSRLRQLTFLTGSASNDTSVKGKIILETGTTAGSLNRLETAEVSEYAPGFSAEVSIGVRVNDTLEGTAQARWGGLSVDSENGLYFKQTNTGIFVVRRKDDVEETVVAQADWNLDPLDGTGKSGLNINQLNGYIWQVNFTWYGYGLIVFGIVRAVPGAGEIQHFIPCHSLQVEGDISISEPNLQIFAEVDNGDQTSNYTLSVGGMQYSTVGINEGARQRSVDEYVSNVTGVGTDLTHLITFQRKSDFLNRLFILESINMTAVSERIIFEVWLDGTVTLGNGVVYETATSYDADETSVETVTEQTFDNTDAVLLYRTSVEAGQGNQEGDQMGSIIDLNLPAGATITVTARTLTGTGSVGWCQVTGREGW